MPSQECLDPAIECLLSARLHAFEESEHFAHARSSAGGLKAVRSRAADDGCAHLLMAAQSDHTQAGRQLEAESKFVLELHRVRRIEDDRNVKLFLVMELLQIRSLDPGEDVPVDKAHVVAGRVIAVITELGARP